MKKFIFATDVDGTLLTDDKKIHPTTLEAFKQSKEMGHINVIATGRAVIRTKILLKMIPYIDYFVCNNGAVVYDVTKNKALVMHGVNPKHYIKIMDFYKKHKENNEYITFKLHTNEDWIGFPENENENPTPLTKELDLNIRNHIINNPNDNKLFNGDIPTQMSIHASETFCKEHLNEFQSWFEADSSVFLTNSIYLDVNPKNVSKWTGLLELAQHLNISKEQIVTFGDSGNDYEMLVNAGKNGYPLANSKMELVEKIQPKIGSNNTGAIGETINKYLSKK